MKEKSTGDITTIPNPESYNITFNKDGTFSGQADCNSIGGAYSQESGFSIELCPSTMAYCGEESMDTQYLALLDGVAAGGPDGDGGLALETAASAQRMEFSNGGDAPEQAGATASRISKDVTPMKIQVFCSTSG